MRTLSVLLENTSIVNGFCLLKPGFIKYKDEFKGMLEANNWEIIDEKQTKLSLEQCQELYKSLSEESFYFKLCQYMSSDNIYCFICHTDDKDPIDKMNSLKKKVRAEWGVDDMKNAMHSSDSISNVKRESKIVFGHNIVESKDKKNKTKDKTTHSSNLKKYQNTLDDIMFYPTKIYDRISIDGIKNYLATGKYNINTIVMMNDKGDIAVKFEKNFFKQENNDIKKHILDIGLDLKTELGVRKITIDDKNNSLIIHH